MIQGIFPRFDTHIPLTILFNIYKSKILYFCYWRSGKLSKKPEVFIMKACLFDNERS